MAVAALTFALVNAVRHQARLRDQRERAAAARQAKAAATAWQPKVTAAFQPVHAALSSFVGGTQEWSSGSLDDGEFRARVVSDLAAFVRARDAVEALPPMAAASNGPRAKDLYVRSAELYEQAARTELIAVDTPPGDLRVQLRLLGQRLRELADRVFDRGGVVVSHAIGQVTDPNFVVNLPEEVPIWGTEGLAPGPPLDVGVTGPVGLPPQRQANRPQQSRARWRAAVARLDVPSARAVAAAIRNGDGNRLRTLARTLTAASESLRTTADPTGDREGAVVVRLGLLVGAEAARAAQASRLLRAGVDRDQLELVAQRLALVSDHLWAEDLPPRRSGFPAAILHAAA